LTHRHVIGSPLGKARFHMHNPKTSISVSVTSNQKNVNLVGFKPVAHIESVDISTLFFSGCNE